MNKETDEVGKETNIEQEIPAEEKTLTPTERLEALMTELSKTKAELADAKVKIEGGEGFKSIQRSLVEKDKVLKRLESERANISSLSAKVDVQGGMLSEIIARLEDREEAYPEEKPPKEKVDYAKRFQEAEAMSSMKAQIETRYRRAEALGIPMTDPRIERIERFTTRGLYDEADNALDALEAEVNKSKEGPKDEKSKETEAERIEKLIEEKARQILEEKGLLGIEAGRPSSGGKGSTISVDAYRGMSPQERLKFHREHPNVIIK